MTHVLGIRGLRSKIKGYEDTTEQLGNRMPADTYESDGSIES